MFSQQLFRSHNGQVMWSPCSSPWRSTRLNPTDSSRKTSIATFPGLWSQCATWSWQENNKRLKLLGSCKSINILTVGHLGSVPLHASPCWTFLPPSYVVCGKVMFSVVCLSVCSWGDHVTDPCIIWDPYQMRNHLPHGPVQTCWLGTRPYHMETPPTKGSRSNLFTWNPPTTWGCLLANARLAFCWKAFLLNMFLSIFLSLPDLGVLFHPLCKYSHLEVGSSAFVSIWTEMTPYLVPVLFIRWL